MMFDRSVLKSLGFAILISLALLGALSLLPEREPDPLNPFSLEFRVSRLELEVAKMKRDLNKPSRPGVDVLWTP